MALLKNKTQGSYVIVNKAITSDKELCLKDRGMLVTLHALPDEWNLTVKGMESILPDGREAITAALKSLEEKGYLVKRQVRNKRGKFAYNEFEVFDRPKLPITGNPLTDKPVTDKPLTENPQQYNNNKKNNNKNNKLNNKKGSKKSIPSYPIKKNDFHCLLQNDYDFDSLEKALLGAT